MAEVRSKVVVSTNGSLTGGDSRVEQLGSNASSTTFSEPENAAQRRKNVSEDLGSMAIGPGRQLAESLHRGDGTSSPHHHSLAHAEGHAVYRAATELRNAGVVHHVLADDERRIVEPHMPTSPLMDHALEANPGMTPEQYINAEATTLAWNDVAMHGTVVGPKSHLPNGRSNPGAWADGGAWNTCENCREQTLANMKKHRG